MPVRRILLAALVAPLTLVAQAPRASSGVLAARADSARYPWTVADVRFMTDMIGHHAQAITMSRLAPTHGASDAIQRLAARIINAQHDEIRAMQSWLRDRQQPVPDPRLGADEHAGHAMPRADTAHAGHTMPRADSAHAGHHAPATPAPATMSHDMHGDHAMMPGMLTPAQMTQLEAARGEEFDRLFLELMIQHHKGATSMVRTLMDSPRAAQDFTVFKFAADVNVDQTTEIQRMQRMLVDQMFPVRRQ
jgi:uncharacterized protein (DUF305 family)